MSFFVPPLTEYNSLEANQRSRKIRVQGFENVLKEQFQLAYFGKIDYSASEQMTVQERRIMYKLLLEQKQDEKKQRDEAMKIAKAKSKSMAGRGRR